MTPLLAWRVSIKQNIFAILFGVLIFASVRVGASDIYDMVILNGRVIDPETNFDAVRNVGINNDKITSITKRNIIGKESIDATGFVIAPGFIDQHWHGLDLLTTKIGLRGGITTGMDLEVGALNVAKWYAAKAGKSPMNYGTTVSHLMARLLVHDAEEVTAQNQIDLNAPMTVLDVTALMKFAANDGVPGWSLNRSSREQTNRITETLEKGLREGALGVGTVPGYSRSGITTYELFLVQKAAANYGRLTSVHGRFYPSALTPIEHPTGFNEVSPTPSYSVRL